jgi:tetratricopeptide (TPR) repeat protein
LLANAGRYREALADLEALDKQMPDNPQLLERIAALYQASNDWGRAADAYSRLLAIDPTNTAARRARGDCYLNLGRHASAAADYEALLRIDPADINALNNLAWLLATSPMAGLRDGKRAVALAWRACEATGFERADLVSTLAAAYAESGDFENAVRFSKMALSIGGQPLEDDLRRQFEHYQTGKPWREAMPPAAESVPRPDARQAS